MSNVSCYGREELPPLPNPDYEYETPTSEPPPIRPEEMLHFFQKPECVDNYYDCLKRIPKKITGRLTEKRVIAWGLHAQASISFFRIMVIAASILVGTVAWVVWWLVDHPGDLQNSFVPPAFAVSLLAVGVVLPQYIDAQQQKLKEA